VLSANGDATLSLLCSILLLPLLRLIFMLKAELCYPVLPTQLQQSLLSVLAGRPTLDMHRAVAVVAAPTALVFETGPMERGRGRGRRNGLAGKLPSDTGRSVTVVASSMVLWSKMAMAAAATAFSARDYRSIDDGISTLMCAREANADCCSNR